MRNPESAQEKISQSELNLKSANASQKSIVSPFLNTEEAAQFVRLNKRTLENMRLYGNGPAFRKHGNRVYYHIDDLNGWSSERSQTNI